MSFILDLDTLFTSHGYYSTSKEDHTHYIETSSTGSAGSLRVFNDGRVEYEYLTTPKQSPMSVCDLTEADGMTKLLGILRDQAFGEGYAEGHRDGELSGINSAQNCFENAYWEYLDGKSSDFDPTFYDNEGNLIDR